MRKKVSIRFDAVKNAFRAFDPTTGKALTTYADLRFGDTRAAQDGTGDDPTVSIQTFKDPSADATKGGAMKDPSPNTAAQLVGWALVPD